MADIYMVTNEVDKTFTARLKDGSENMDLTDASSVVFVIDSVGSYIASIEDADDGEVEVTIDSISTEGTYYAEFQVTFNNGQKISFPSASNIEIRVKQGLSES